MKIPKAKKLPSGNYCIELRLGGERYSITRRTEKECRKEAQIVKAEYLAGKKEKKPDPVKLPTLEKLIEQNIAKKESVLSPSTIAGYEVIKKNRFPDQMKKSASDITNDEWELAFYKEATKISAKTLQNSWSYIGTVLREEAGLRLPDVKMPQIAPNAHPYLEPEQIKTFIKAVHGKKVELPALLALCGLRKSEVLALTWDNIDLKKKVIYVRGAAVMDKNHKLVQKKENKNTTSTRTVPIMIDELYTALNAVEDKTGFIVDCAQNTFYSRVNEVCEDAGLPKVGVHGLRHSFASLAYHLGIPERVTMRIGGWSNIQTMHKIYIHIAQADVVSYTNEINNYLSGNKPEAS